MAEQEDFLRPLIQEVIQQVLEGEMKEPSGAGKSERTPNRQAYLAGYLTHTTPRRLWQHILSYQYQEPSHTQVTGLIMNPGSRDLSQLDSRGGPFAGGAFQRNAPPGLILKL